MESTAVPGRTNAIWPYVQIARPDHWVKNVFMLLGVVTALFLDPSRVSFQSIPMVALAVLVACLVASSNYVLNEVLDAPTDRLHPEKRHRPAASGQIRFGIAVTEWIALAAVGLSFAWLINSAFFVSALAFWVMGIVYNVPPIRTKALPYVDVLSEALNNPIRLLLGWFAVIQDLVPPVSLFIAFWMAGAYFMAMKRLAEYRHIANKETAARYRRSFRYYDEDRLMMGITFYVVVAALFTGVFVVRYHLELILAMPLVAGFFAYYMKIGLREDSPVQNPERLHREHGLMAYGVVCSLVLGLLMFTDIPILYDLFKVIPAKALPLWTIGG
jgi:4-hydroxybenzoate polyprenyltransferase